MIGRCRSVLCAGLVAGLVLTSLARVLASGFGFLPVQLYLGPKTSSATLTLRSQDERDLRFELGVYSWNQDSEGKAQLTPTKDIVFFPQLFVLEAGKERIIRVGASERSVPTEQSYRIFVKQIPSLGTSDSSGQVNILTNLSIPIFIEPTRPVLKGQIDSVSVRDRKVSFQVKNVGNVHFQVKTLSVKAFDAAQRKLFEPKLAGWYVLAGGVRNYDIALPPADCSRIKTLTIEAQHEHGSLTARFDLPPSACGG